MALPSVCVTCSCPTTSLKRCGRYLRAMTWYDMRSITNGKSQNLNQAGNQKKCQGDHGGCGANCRCCIPALAGFVSPHSMGPGAINLPQARGRRKKNDKKIKARLSG